MTAEDTYDVFISYARRDSSKTARRLFEDLTVAGSKVWWDQGGRIGYGVRFDVAIEQGIRNTRQFVILLTPAAMREDGFVRLELAYALSCGKQPIPVMLIDCMPPIQIITANWIDMRTGYEDAVAALTTALRDGTRNGAMWRVYGDPPIHAPAQFIGRTDIIRSLREALDDLVSHQRGGRHLIPGARSVGKTTLLRHFKDIAAQYPVNVLFADLSAAGAQTSGYHDPALTAINQLWAQLLKNETTKRFHSAITEPDRAESRLKWLGGAIEANAREQPIVLLLDNLHLDSTGIFPSWFKRAFRQQLILVIATYLDDPFMPPPDDFATSRNVHPLIPLQTDELRYLFDPPDTVHGARLFELSDGMPTCVETILEAWKRTRAVVQTDHGLVVTYRDEELPDVWEPLIEDRLSIAAEAAGIADTYSIDELLD